MLKGDEQRITEVREFRTKLENLFKERGIRLPLELSFCVCELAIAYALGFAQKTINETHREKFQV